MNTTFGKIFLLVVAVLVLGLGSLLFFMKPDKTPQGIFDPNVIVRERLKEQPTEMVAGKIVEIRDGIIILDVPKVLEVGISEGADLRTRIVSVSSDVAIIVRSEKDEETLSRELKKYRPDSGAPPPSPYTEKSIKLSDLKLGDFIFVRGMAGVDIGQTKGIVAASIIKSQ